MPIDASIPLQGRQPDNLLQTLGQVYALKSQAQEQQLRGLGIQQAQNQLNDQQGLAQAYQQSIKPGGGFDQQQFEQGVLQHAPRMYGQVLQQGLERQKMQLGLQQEQLSNLAAHNGYVAQHLQGISDAPPEQKQTVYTQRRNQMIQEGTLQPGGPQDPGALYPGDDAINRLLSQTMSVKDTIAAHQKDVENQVKALTLQETGRHNVATENQAQQTLAQTAKRDANTAAYQRGELGIGAGRNALEGQRNNIESQKLGLEYGLTGGGNPNLKGDAYLQSLPPAMQQTVKSIANGDVAMPSARIGGGSMLRNAVLMYDPTYTQARYDTKQNFKTKGDAQTVANLSTTLGHLDNLQKTSDALGTAPLLGTKFQTPSDNGLEAALTGASGEIGKLITGGVVPEGEFNALKESMSSMSQAKRAAAISKFRELISDRIGSMMQKYKAGTGQEMPTEFFDPATQQRLGALMGKGAAPAGPKAGDIEDGHRFKGGDPSKPESWEKVQ